MSETLDQVWIAFSEDTGVLGTAADLDLGKQIVEDYLLSRNGDQVAGWRRESSVWSTTGRQWAARFYVEAFHVRRHRSASS